MKAITLWQPWASLLACKAKRYETKPWSTEYRGPIAIHASVKKFEPLDFTVFDPAFAKAACDTLEANGLSIHNLPSGCVIATAELVGCRLTRSYIEEDDSEVFLLRIPGDKNDEPVTGWELIKGNEFLFGDWTPGRYAWEFANVKMLPEPIPAKGKQRLWNWEEG